MDVGSSKEGLLPAIWLEEKDLKGGWKDSFEAEDTILVIDNKAVTNRPDLWGHRGFAREVAALLGKQLVEDDMLFASLPIKHYEKQAPAQGTNVFSVEIAQESGACGHPCNRLAALYVPTIQQRASLLHMAVRLARVDARPLDMLVDLTNYVMFDIGHPMHAFDADAIFSKKLVGRCAREGEKLALLDGEEVTLTNYDYVITDGVQPLAVAGVMGGTSTAVTGTTKSVLLEAAHFEPTPIRRTSTRLKKRTEASARFEKNLDPNQNTAALLRYIRLLDDADVPYTVADTVVSLGALAQEKVITVRHALIESKMGRTVSAAVVESVLTALGFGVIKQGVEKELTYSVSVPTFRATKDVTIAEDIVEEIARFVGLTTIKPILPIRAMSAFDTQPIGRMRSLKAFFAQHLDMHEVQTYSFYDEEFLKSISYNPRDTLDIANPLSEHWQRLVTSLVPNLLKCIVTNQSHEAMRFFECNRVWFYTDQAVETREVAGVWYEMKNTLDFYEVKDALEAVFHFLKLPIRWEKPSRPLDPWYDIHQTAELWHGDRIIGQAGKAAPLFLKSVAPGDAFIFELDLNVLVHTDPEKVLFKPLRKYPTTDLDISVIVPLGCTVQGIEQTIKQADSHITRVQLVDSFTRPEWVDKKSLTFRFIAYDSEGTLTKEAIDSIWDQVKLAVNAIGAEVR